MNHPLLGVKTIIPDLHPRPFHIGVPTPPVCRLLGVSFLMATSFTTLSQTGASECFRILLCYAIHLLVASDTTRMYSTQIQLYTASFVLTKTNLSGYNIILSRMHKRFGQKLCKSYAFYSSFRKSEKLPEDVYRLSANSELDEPMQSKDHNYIIAYSQSQKQFVDFYYTSNISPHRYSSVNILTR